MPQPARRGLKLVIGGGCLLLVLALLCGGALVCGTAGLGAWFGAEQARETEAVVAQSEAHVRVHPAILAAVGGGLVSVAADPLDTAVRLGAARVALTVTGERGEVQVTVYLRETGDVWEVAGLEASGSGLNLMEGEVVEVSSSSSDWD